MAQDLDRDILGDAVLFDQAATEIELDLGGGRKADLDLFEANTQEHVEILELLFDAHGLGEGLIAIAEIDAAPDRSLGERAVGPLAIG